LITALKQVTLSVYGGIVSLFAVLHLKPAQQLTLFENIYQILSPNGLFLIGTVEKALPFVTDSH
jgi:cyclopropane fatty-acyl-phospholipid synthase-like methyltransferase